MFFESIDEATERRLVEKWKEMNERDKDHFINQVSLALSVWGSDEIGKRYIMEVLKAMVGNGVTTLADFGLYVKELMGKNIAAARKDRIKRASLVLEGYRIKNELPSEPHRDLGL